MSSWTGFNRMIMERNRSMSYFHRRKIIPQEPRKRKREYISVAEAQEAGKLPKGYYIVIRHEGGHVFYLTDIDRTYKAEPSWTWKPQRDAGEAIIFGTKQEAQQAAALCRGTIRRRTQNHATHQN